MTADETDLLIQLVRRKHQCLKRLDEMGKKQLGLVREGHLAQLLDVLAAKQRVLGDLEKTEQALGPFRHEHPNRRNWRRPEDRRQCRELIDQCEHLLNQIMVRERASERELDRRRQEAAAQLEGAHRASRARVAYLAASPAAPRQLDLSAGD